MAVAPVENTTTEPGLGLRFTDALRTRFERYGAVTVIDDISGADAVLKTKVKDVDTRVRNVSGTTDQELDLELVLITSAELRRRNGQILWRDDNLRVSQSFAGVGSVVVTRGATFAGGDIGASQLSTLSTREVSRGQKEAALDEAMDEASRRIYNEAVAADF